MSGLREFLTTQQLLTLATVDEHGKPWTANVFYGVDDQFRLFFISARNAAHSTHLEAQPVCSFTAAWFDPNDHTNRKAVQGTGECRIAEMAEDIQLGVRIHNTRFPEFAERITVEYINDHTNPAAVYILTPHRIKHWDDQEYGMNGTKEFTF